MMDPRLEAIYVRLMKETERRRQQGSVFEIGEDLKTIIDVIDRIDEDLQIIRARVGT